MSAPAQAAAAAALAQGWRALQIDANPPALAWLQERAGRPGAPLDEVAAALLAPARLAALSLQAPVAHALAALRALATQPQRAALLLREGALLGLEGLEEGLARLLEAGLLLLRPGAGRRAWTFEEELSSRAFLRRELWLPEAALDWWAHAAPSHAERRAVVAARPEEVSPQPRGDARALELELLRVVSALDREALPLNKDGTPNLRALGRVLRALDLSEPEPLERAYFWLALARALGALALRAGALEAAPAQAAAFFEAPEPERARALVRAWRGLATWDEPGAAAALARQTDARRGVLDRDTPAARLAGPRGQLLEDLARLPLDAWCRAEIVTARLLALDRNYLASTLSGAYGGEAADPRGFIEAALRISLTWLGFLEWGRHPEDGEVLRWSPRGALAAGLPPREEPTTPRPCLVVQPNLEVTVLLEDAPLAVLARLSALGERGALADRAAIWALDAANVQRAYGRGQRAQEVIDFLRAHSRAPLPPSVEFTLRDWERVHRKITLYASGALLHHPDADRLDLLLETVSHAHAGLPAPVRLSGVEAFWPDFPPELARHNAVGAVRVFDLSSAPAHAGDPCLRYAEGLRLEPCPGGLDLVTAAAMPALARPTGDGAWALDGDLVRAALGVQAREKIVEFFEGRVEGGLSARLRLRLESLADAAVRAAVRPAVPLLVVSAPEVADALCELHQVEEWIEARLGPVAFALKPGGAAPIQEALRALGLDASPQE